MKRSRRILIYLPVKKDFIPPTLGGNFCLEDKRQKVCNAHNLRELLLRIILLMTKKKTEL